MKGHSATGHVWMALGCQGFLACLQLRRGSHVFGLYVRFTCPLAIMPSADRVPVKSPHSTMLWPEWVVPVTGSTSSALHAVCPFQPFLPRHRWRNSVFSAGLGYLASATGSL
jgi:hypothetical protein